MSPNEANNLAKTLTKGGVVGVMIALILLCGTIGWFYFKTTSNHIEHTQAAWEANTEARSEDSKLISDAILKSAEATTELTTYLRTKLE